MSDDRRDSVDGLWVNISPGGPVQRFARLPPLADTHERSDTRESQNSIALESTVPRFRECLSLPLACSEEDEKEHLPALMDVDLVTPVLPAEVLDDNEHCGDTTSISDCAAPENSSHGTPKGEKQRGAGPPKMTMLASPGVDILCTDLAGWDSCSGSAASSVSSRGTQASSMTNGPGELPIPLIPEQKAFGLLNVLLDGVTLEVLGCTVGAMTVTGPLAYEDSFQSMLLNFDAFYPWMQDSVNLFLADCQEDLEPLVLKLAPKTGSERRKFEFHVTANLIQIGLDARASMMGVENPPGFEDEEHDVLCLLDLSNLKLYWHAHQEKARPQSRRAPRKSRP